MVIFVLSLPTLPAYENFASWSQLKSFGFVSCPPPSTILAFSLLAIAGGKSWKPRYLAVILRQNNSQYLTFSISYYSTITKVERFK
jgi:hypothetical protein